MLDQHAVGAVAGCSADGLASEQPSKAPRVDIGLNGEAAKRCGIETVHGASSCPHGALANPPRFAVSQTLQEVVIPLGCVRILRMPQAELTTERALACELLNQLGFEELADHLAKTSEGPPCPWLNDAEHRTLNGVFAAMPELGGPPVSFTMAIGAAPETNAQIGPDPDGMLHFARPPDIAGAAGSIRYWLGTLSAPLIMDIPGASRTRGGRRSPLDLRAILQQIGWAIERTAKKRRAAPPRTAWCVAALIIIENRQQTFHQELAVNDDAYPFFDHMKWDARCETQRDLIDARKAARAKVAAVSRGVHRTEAVRLINDEVRSLIRDRRQPS